MSDNAYQAIIERLFPGAQLESMIALTGGVSADVYRLDLKLPDGWTDTVVLRIHGETHAGHEAELEYALLEALHQTTLPVPEPLLVDTSTTILPAPFIVMSFIDGSSDAPALSADARIENMATQLLGVHATDIAELPLLPSRVDPLPELFDFLPDDKRWDTLRDYLVSLTDTGYQGPPRLLHGDFWPENLLWRDNQIVGVLDWEDAAIGDPLSDVACSRLELRYLYGKKGMQLFTNAYAKQDPLDPERLALWQIYVAAAAQRFMGDWELAADREAHMRNQALLSIEEAAASLMG